jgi:hypothetical protein
MTAAKRSAFGIVLAAATAASTSGLCLAADLRWKATGDVTAVYTDNVYYESDQSATDAVATTGGSASFGIGLTDATPRSELAFGYKGSYRNFPRETKANNLEQYLSLTWNTFLSQRVSLTLLETASRSPEADNYEDRGVDQGLTVGTRARQFRNTSGFGFNVRMAPRWSFRADYAYRLLNNGRIQRPKDAPPATAECNGGFCIPGPGTDSNGDGTIDEAVPTVENLDLLDERGHTASAGISHQLSPSSDLTLSATYIRNATLDDLFGGSTIRRSHSYGGNVIYAWKRVRGAVVSLSDETSTTETKKTPAGGTSTSTSAGSGEAVDESQRTTQRRPTDEAPVAPLSAGSERPRGGIEAARHAAQQAAGPNAGRVFALPTDTLNIWFGAGAYRVTDTLGNRLATLLGATNREESSTEYSGEIGLIRTYGRGSISAGLTRGVSTFEGLGRRELVDTNGDGTAETAVQIPAGSAVRTTLYASYIFTLTRISHFNFSLNATRRSGIESREFDIQGEQADAGRSRVTAVGAGIGYDLQFASWGGLRASYRYVKQRAPGTQLLSDLDFGRSTAILGFFFTTR